jgi:uroporphyrinogen-III decarboxylase
MNGKERELAMIDGKAVDHLPLMPITMLFGADLAGVPYRDYAADCRVLAEVQMRTAETFGFDHVSTISDPAREVSDLGGTVEWFDNQPPAIVESRALLEDKSRLATLKLPSMAAPGRMRDLIDAVDCRPRSSPGCGVLSRSSGMPLTQVRRPATGRIRGSSLGPYRPRQR